MDFIEEISKKTIEDLRDPIAKEQLIYNYFKFRKTLISKLYKQQTYIDALEDEQLFDLLGEDVDNVVILSLGTEKFCLLVSEYLENKNKEEDRMKGVDIKDLVGE